MKILVTGGAGFIASHVAEALMRAGHSIVIVDDLSTGRRENLPSGATFYELDICDQPALDAVIAAERPELIDHHAAQMDVRRSVREPLFDARVNIVAPLAMLEMAVKHGVKKIVYASTGGATYGDVKQVPVDESHPAEPICHYGVSKLTLERYLFLYRHLYGLDYTVLRYPNVYGPRQNPRGEAGVVSIFALQMLEGEQPTIYGDGSKTRDYVYVDDVVGANLAALDKGSGEIINLGWGKPVSDFDIFAAVRRATGYKGEPRYAPVRPGEVEHIALDASKAKRILGWEPTMPLQEGIDLSVNFIRAGYARSANQ
ncbi:MAG TPA: NAD-dependent epimerase/dehydratase family protein [Terriglobales bacterium]|nr:NAD-dependent epimerase/dehydratase family protein [Terriglobales bacterium]